MGVVLVDDHLCLEALAGRRIPSTDGSDVVATTCGFHYRLLRALADDRVIGSLSRGAATAIRERAADPPPARLVILDPRVSTAIAADIAARHGLNLLASELIAAARVHHGRVVLTESNVGRRWPDALAAGEVALHIVP